MDLSYKTESSFWYLLAQETAEANAVHLAAALLALNRSVQEGELPVRYEDPKARSWALACYLFEFGQGFSQELGQIGYSQMVRGFDHYLGTRGFVQHAYSLINANIRSPASPERERDESIADTFLINGLTLTVQLPGALDGTLMERILGDDGLLFLGMQATALPFDASESSVRVYAAHRPGFLRRMLTDPRSWLPRQMGG